MYRDEVLRTAAKTNRDEVLMAALGLCGEAGEVAELIKKHIFHGKPLDNDALIKELGDVRWYFELLCKVANTTIEEVEKRNIEKLKLRYPTEFTTKDSIEKKDEIK